MKHALIYSAKRLMSVSAEALENKIKSAFNPVHMEVNDVSGGCGQSFEVIIVSDAFVNKSILERHRIVNGALKDEISKMHAFSQKSFTEEQWKNQKK